MKSIINSIAAMLQAAFSALAKFFEYKTKVEIPEQIKTLNKECYALENEIGKIRNELEREDNALRVVSLNDHANRLRGRLKNARAEVKRLRKLRDQNQGGAEN